MSDELRGLELSDETMLPEQTVLIELRERLMPVSARLAASLGQHFSAFRAEVPGADASAFVKWLHLRGQIDAALAEELLAELSVEVTGLDVLSGFYDQTQTVDLKHGDWHAPALGEPIRRGGAYQLLKQVGAGAMGSVHLAKDRLLRRTVALKRLLPPKADHPEACSHGPAAMNPLVIQRFLGEAQITSQLDHPNVIPIYGLESGADGEVAYTMKMIQGKSLKQWLAEARAAYSAGRVSEQLSTQARLRLFLKICDALAFAHAKGVIHRDLKPANIMLGRYGEVYVMDWGIARPFKLSGAAARVVEVDNLAIYAAEKGQIVGTPRYMSPEQAAGMNDELDARSDLFALGLILYELIGLKQAIQAKDMTGLLQKVIRRQIAALQAPAGERLSPALASIVAKATARRRAERYQSVSELAADLRRYLDDEQVHAHHETALQRLERAIKRHRQAVLPALLGLLLVSGGLSLSLQVLKQYQLEQSEWQRAQTGRLLSALGNHSQLLGGRFQLLEGLLQELAAAAKVSLTSGLPLGGRVYLSEDFVPGRAPADWLPAPATRRKLSLDWPVIKLAPGVSPAPESLLRLSALRHSFYRIFAESRGPAFMALDPETQRRRLRAEPGTLLNAYVGLATGQHLSYPGKGGYTADYDPRTRPWYRLGTGKQALSWGTPFEDALGLGKVIPCVEPIKDASGALLGVAGIEISLAEVSREWLPLPDHPEVEAVYLVNAAGELVAAWPPTSGDTVWAVDKTPAGARAVLDQALKSGATGFERLESTGRFYAYTRLGRQDWRLVIRGDLKKLLAR